MNLEINPKKELFKWGPIKLRLVYPSLFIEVILVRATKHYPWAWPPSLCIFKNGIATWVCEDLALSKGGSKYFKRYFLNLKNYKKHWLAWKNWIKEYQDFVKNFEQTNFRKLSNREFYRHLNYFYDLNIRFWLITHVPEYANWGGEYLLKNKLKKRYKNKADEYLEILSAPVKFSFFQEEEIDLLKIAFMKKKKEGQKALKEHAKNYHWILNSYGGNRVLKKEYFEKKLTELLKEKPAQKKIQEIKNTIVKNKKRKAELIQKLKLNKEISLVAEQLSQSIWWQDLRKSYIWRMHYFWDKFLCEIAKRTNWKFSELQWCWAYELLDVLSNKKINKKEVVARKKYYTIYAKEGKLKTFIKKEAVEKLINIYLKIEIKDTKELKGLVVSRGKKTVVQGRVKIVRSPLLEAKKMKKGDILVAGMTSPEYIVVMRKAAAIITDHGGMTAHAAIVSRELNIPCIVKTQIATAILHDGDLVEVDTNTGIARKLK